VVGVAERVIVVGAGVVGLTCAVRLAEAGYEVHVMARDLPLETTSAVAAALWYPYRALPREQVTAWSQRTFGVLAHLAKSTPAAAVRMRAGRELLRTPSPDPWWRNAVPALTRLAPGERPPGYADGWRLHLPVVDMPRYLPWLLGRLQTAGGTITRHALTALPTAPLVVNCSGLAARALAGDVSVTPVRGQVVRVAQDGIDEWLLDQSDPQRLVYVVPREHEVVVGGTATELDWEPAPDPATTLAILERASALVPALRTARVLGVRVGLRPARPAVRLDHEKYDDGRVVVHCYGHGGAGVTMSWGCADEVLGQVRAVTT
jgi:D-amino-acid oxidase